MFKINISDYKGFQRTIEMKEQELKESVKILTTKCILVHYLEGVEIPDLNKTIIFVNDNTAMIPTGEFDENDQPILMGDYDIVVAKSEAGISTKQLFRELIAYTDGANINSKANYKF